MIFLVNSGSQIFKEYFKELVNVPNRDIVDEYIETLYNFVFCFIDTTATAGHATQDGGLSLYKRIKQTNTISDVQSHLASSENLSIIWLSQCLFEVPMTIYTDEDKRTLLKRIAGVCEQVAARQADLSEQQKAPIFLQKKLS